MINFQQNKNNQHKSLRFCKGNAVFSFVHFCIKLEIFFNIKMIKKLSFLQRNISMDTNMTKEFVISVTGLVKIITVNSIFGAKGVTYIDNIRK